MADETPDQLRNHRDQLKSENDRLNPELDQMKLKLQAATQANAALQQQVKVGQAKLDAAGKQIAALAAELQAAKTAAAEPKTTPAQA